MFPEVYQKPVVWDEIPEAINLLSPEENPENYQLLEIGNPHYDGNPRNSPEYRRTAFTSTLGLLLKIEPEFVRERAPDLPVHSSPNGEFTGKYRYSLIAMEPEVALRFLEPIPYKS